MASHSFLIVIKSFNIFYVRVNLSWFTVEYVSITLYFNCTNAHLHKTSAFGTVITIATKCDPPPSNEA